MFPDFLYLYHSFQDSQTQPYSAEYTVHYRHISNPGFHHILCSCIFTSKYYSGISHILFWSSRLDLLFGRVSLYKKVDSYLTRLTAKILSNCKWHDKRMLWNREYIRTIDNSWYDAGVLFFFRVEENSESWKFPWGHKDHYHRDL